MQHKVKLTVIDKKLYPELQAQYCADPHSGACPCYNVGDTFIFERYGTADDFWHMGLNTLKQTDNGVDRIAGGAAFPHCSEAWDAISRYIYTGLQGGSIMRGWMNDERVMIACCSDGTRPVIFKIERMDYKAVYIDKVMDAECQNKLKDAFMQIAAVTDVVFRDGYAEIYLQSDVTDEALTNAAASCGEYSIVKID
ncbi:MAG TPA: TIGR04076 family protein [Candidatus Faecousia intestinigallinarum]|nr:TIGR04076 family protein [Candidatus Faecousia intestinigallinarum]